MTKSASSFFATVVVAVSLFASNVQAEFFGLPNGRSASPGLLSELSVELGFVTGDLDVIDYQNFGARVNYRVAPDIVVLGDIGFSEYGSADGTPAGLGIIYHLANQRISQAMDIAGKASYHMGEYKGGDANFDLTGISLEVLFSGRQPLTASGLGWYGNVGYHRITVKSEVLKDSTNEIGVGGGFTLLTGFGEAYIGIDLIDELTLGLGLRYFVQ